MAYNTLLDSASISDVKGEDYKPNTQSLILKKPPQ